MAMTTGGLVRKSLDSPDEVRPFENDSGELQVVSIGDSGIVGRGVFKPGWRWSKDVKPIAKTESCQGAHAGYVISGRMRVVMDDGTEDEFGPGDVMLAPPGHDAWTVGNEACVVVDWQGFGNYAKRA
jgi:EutQ-like cupin domain